MPVVFDVETYEKILLAIIKHVDINLNTDEVVEELKMTVSSDFTKRTLENKFSNLKRKDAQGKFSSVADVSSATIKDTSQPSAQASTTPKKRGRKPKSEKTPANDHTLTSPVDSGHAVEDATSPLIKDQATPGKVSKRKPSKMNDGDVGSNISPKKAKTDHIIKNEHISDDEYA